MKLGPLTEDEYLEWQIRRELDQHAGGIRRSLVGRVVCFFRGHAWNEGFWSTRCERCGLVKQDRLYQVPHD